MDSSSAEVSYNLKLADQWLFMTDIQVEHGIIYISHCNKNILPLLGPYKLDLSFLR